MKIEANKSTAVKKRKKYSEMSATQKSTYLFGTSSVPYNKRHDPTNKYVVFPWTNISSILTEVFRDKKLRLNDQPGLSDSIGFDIGAPYKPHRRGAVLAFKQALTLPFKDLKQAHGRYYFDLSPLTLSNCLAIAACLRGIPATSQLYNELCNEAERVQDHSLARVKPKSKPITERLNQARRTSRATTLGWPSRLTASSPSVDPFDGAINTHTSGRVVATEGGATSTFQRSSSFIANMLAETPPPTFAAVPEPTDGWMEITESDIRNAMEAHIQAQRRINLD